MNCLERFVCESDGAVAPVVGIALVALVAMGGLAYDVSRAFALRAELDAAVDAAALAGATQLDAQPGAVARARAAAQGALVRNAQRLGNTAESNVAITAADITFLTDLTSRTTTTADATARFIQINLAPRSLGLVFGSLVHTGGFQVRAHAVAGYGVALCKSPPIFVCNPAEPANNTDLDLSFDGDLYIGKALKLTPGNGGPGNFGFIDVGGGAQALKEAMGRLSSQTQCFGSEVETEPGNKTSVDAYINTRFDMNDMGADYPPASNTIIGVGGKCTTPPPPSDDCSVTTAASTGITGLPIDCGQGSAVIGSGQWNAARYLATNHGITTAPALYAPQTPAGATQPGWLAYGPVGLGTTPTRFQVYNWELAMLRGQISPTFAHGQGGTDVANDLAAPACNKSFTVASPPPGPDRRTMSAVVTNCRAENIKGKTDIHVIGYVDLFLIDPVVNGNLYGEVIGMTTKSSAVGKYTLTHTVRLYE